MKVTNAILSLLASQAAAQVIDIQIGDTAALGLMREVAQAEKSGDHARAAELRDLLSKSRGPSRERTQWKTECSVSSNINAEIYVVPDPSNAPKEIAWAMDYLDKYWTTDDGGELPYPGDFDRFMHSDGFRIIRTDYKDLPWAVRKYREELLKGGTKMERKFIAELDGVAFFAPGVVTWLAPLFAGSDVKPGQNACEDELVDFSNWDKTKIGSEDVKFSFNYGGRMQVGNSIGIQVHAKKSMKQESNRKTEEAIKKVAESEAEAGEL
ncbi:hypothetical protein FVEN_g3034 [Fusarium venenatum]|uniref:Uncharacterized protein n=2 Tax=Fusarium venenatum TaxID=56646 RepID=A0A2L2T336_9HYPO|nr:uncharacterized protein FVRRES_06429 [Fusarium venenatum]KAG8359555.1 hypothetical protein FVEN_g3034 [Fusarium venenatum]CEI61993.1 unnamed protein product [Fusarium venenatum]